MMVISEIRYLRFNNCSVIQTGGHSTKKKTGFQNLKVYDTYCYCNIYDEVR
jgi:hypothetical protein